MDEFELDYGTGMTQIRELDDKGLRQFELTTGAAFALIFAVLLP